VTRDYHNVCYFHKNMEVLPEVVLKLFSFNVRVFLYQSAYFYSHVISAEWCI